MLLLGDCNHWLKEIKDNSIDLIVTDPPYGIEFMGKDWDKALVHTETWKECYRVLKEGKLAFVMCSPRQDVLSRMIINLQDAGFRTNYTSIYWTYASGFPKAANVSKLIDKKNDRNPNHDFTDYLRSKLTSEKTRSGLDKLLQQRGLISSKTQMGSHYFSYDKQPRLPSIIIYETMKEYLDLDDKFDELIEREEAEREVIDKTHFSGGIARYQGGKAKRIDYAITKPATEAAKKMEGAYVGFQPKPAVEVILVVSKGKTLTWLDQCRIPYSSSDNNVFASLSQVSDSILDAASPTTSYNKIYTNHDHHEDDHDHNLGNELSRWVASVQKQQNHFSNVPLDESSLYGVQDSRSGCPSCLRLYDELVRWKQVYDSGVSPSLNGVLGYIREFALEHKHIPSNQYNAHLSNVDDLLRILGVLVSGDSSAYYNDPRQTNTKRFPANLMVSDNVLNDYSKYFSLDAWADKTFPFIITPKASRAERNKGCEDLPTTKMFPETVWVRKNEPNGKEIGEYLKFWRKKQNIGSTNDLGAYFPSNTGGLTGCVRNWEAGKNIPTKEEWIKLKEILQFDDKYDKIMTEFIEVKSRGLYGSPLPISNHHPTVKPLKLMSYLITMGSREGDLVLDPFCGSGTVCIAADQLHRKWIGIEMNPEYAQIIKKRLMVPLSQLKLTVFE